jgi:hypothetical protein
VLAGKGPRRGRGLDEARPKGERSLEAAGVETCQRQTCKLLTACRFWSNALSRLPLTTYRPRLRSARRSTQVHASRGDILETR